MLRGSVALFFFILQIIANFIFGRNVGAISNSYPLSITPVGITFSIWGIIYSWTFRILLFSLRSKLWDDNIIYLSYLVSCISNR